MVSTASFFFLSPGSPYFSLHQTQRSNPPPRELAWSSVILLSSQCFYLDFLLAVIYETFSNAVSVSISSPLDPFSPVHHVSPWKNKNSIPWAFLNMDSPRSRHLLVVTFLVFLFGFPSIKFFFPRPPAQGASLTCFLPLQGRPFDPLVEVRLRIVFSLF